jgi:hypothetical protein
MLELALVAGLIYLVYSSGAFAPFGISPPPQSGSVAPTVTPQGLQSNVSLVAPPVSLPGVTAGFTAGQGEQIAVGAAGAIGSSAKVLGAIGVGANFVPVVGTAVAAVAAIASALLAGHATRLKQATDENSAMNLGVVGYDEGMQTINAAYNNRQIDGPSAIQLVQSVMAMYWQEVTPHIQPGRNGCSGGAACPPWPATGNGCSGDIGAACCVGCYDLAGGPSTAVLPVSSGGDGVNPYYYGAQGTILALQHGGNLQVVYQSVVGSKYGGKARAGYRLSWVQAGA